MWVVDNLKKTHRTFKSTQKWRNILSGGLDIVFELLAVVTINNSEFRTKKEKYSNREIEILTKVVILCRKTKRSTIKKRKFLLINLNCIKMGEHNWLTRKKWEEPKSNCVSTIVHLKEVLWVIWLEWMWFECYNNNWIEFMIKSETWDFIQRLSDNKGKNKTRKSQRAAREIFKLSANFLCF